MKNHLLLTFFVMGLLTAFSAVQAKEKKTMYKYTDEDGVTHYSEIKKNDQYEEADLPELTIVPSTPIKNTTDSNNNNNNDDEVDPSVVETFTITSPTPNENLWGTGRKLTASVEPLTAAQQANYQVQFILDGQKQKAADSSTQVFTDINRGEHTVQAQLINRFNKKVIKESETVTYFMHQNSKK